MSFDTDDIICRKCMNDFNSQEHQKACGSRSVTEATLDKIYREQSKRRAERVGVDPEVWWEVEVRSRNSPLLRAVIQMLATVDPVKHKTVLLDSLVQADKATDVLQNRALNCISSHGYMGHDG